MTLGKQQGPAAAALGEADAHRLDQLRLSNLTTLLPSFQLRSTAGRAVAQGL